MAADESLAFIDAGVGPRTHALVLGVGDYPFLKGGAGAHTIDASEGMGQLTTSPASARAFVRWLIDPNGYSNPTRPLGSLRVLLSERATSSMFDAAGNELLVNGQPFRPPRADLAPVVQATEEWLAALSTNPDDLGIYFFAGHGVVSGLDQALLLSDFGVHKSAPYRNAIRFDGFHLGMGKALAREQCYFIDACRSYSKHFAATHAFGGDPIIAPGPALADQATARAAPAFHATLLGAKAYGPSGRPSFFTEALLDALKGSCSDNANHPNIWQAETNSLNRGISFLIGEITRRHELQHLQINSASSMSSVLLHQIADPLVPIAVDCTPTERAKAVTLDLDGTPLDPQRNTLVPMGRRRVTANLKGGLFSCERDVRPPYARFPIELK